VGIEIRTATEEEWPQWVDTMWRNFLSRAPEGEAEFRRPGADLTRAWAAIDDGRIAGTLRSWAGELTVPGSAFVKAGCVTNVGVLASHRRQGLLTAMIEADLRDTAARGEPLSILIASEFPIYGRYGYGSAAEHATWEIDALAARFESAPSGSVELTNLTQLRDVGPGVYERYRTVQPGAITRDERWWDITCRVVSEPKPDPEKSFVAISRDDSGEPDGYLHYHTESHWEGRRPRNKLTVDELVGVSPAAENRLWRLACDVDLVAVVEAHDRRVDEVLPWLLADARAARLTGRADFLWVRPLDVVAALRARRYGATGRVVLEVIDTFGLASGRYALESDGEAAECTPTTDDAQLTLSASALGSVYLGGVRLRTLAAAGRVEASDEAALATADAMLAWPVAPWCNTWF
jgi:predicted acetyltransferase